MVVWQGITEGGTAVPVQITEEGKVVAIGEQGPKGDTGQQGPKGDPGGAEWPPNPIEGAFLVWLNGEPTWYTEQPVPIPEGLIGPIIGIPGQDTYTVEAPISTDIFYSGRQVVRANSEGDPILKTWNQSEKWSDLVQGTEHISSSGGPVTALFDGAIGSSYENGVTARTGFSLTINFGSTFNSASEVKLYAYARQDDPDVSTLEINGVSKPIGIPGATGDKANVSPTFTLPGGLQTLVWRYPSSANHVYLKAIEIDGVMLVDLGIPLEPVAKGNVSSVFGNSVLLSRVEGDIGIGDYLLAQPAEMASWLVVKRGIKVS